MKKIPEKLLQNTIQVIRQATHTKFDHGSVERVARQLEGIRDDEDGEFAEELNASYTELQESEDADEELQPNYTDKNTDK